MQGDEFEGKTVIADLSQIRAAKPKERGIPSLVQYNGTSTGKRYLLDKELIKIGRSPGSDINISESSVSRAHAQIHSIDDGVSVEDMGSANGTFVNDTKIEAKQKLNDQDMLRLGTVILRFFSRDNLDGLIQDKIYRMATIDAGTQIFNKQYLLDTLESEFSKAKRTGSHLAIVYFDLDHFKKVNDSFGHNAGDQVLRDTAKVVKQLIRREDIFGRFGGEEFIVVLPNITTQQALKIAENMRQKCETWVHSLEVTEKGQKKQVDHKQTISVGVASVNENMSAMKDLLEDADQKLYKSKQGGRNRVTS